MGRPSSHAAKTEPLIHTTAQAQPALSLAQLSLARLSSAKSALSSAQPECSSACSQLSLFSAQLGVGVGCCIHIYKLNQKFAVTIAPNASCVCYAARLQLCILDSGWHTVECKPCSVLVHGQALVQNVACICPRTAKCERTIPCSAWTYLCV